VFGGVGSGTAAGALSCGGLIPFFTAALLAWLIAPLSQRLARTLNLLDRPDTALKKQGQPIPYLGGVAIFMAVVGSLAAWPQVLGTWPQVLGTWPQILGTWPKVLGTWPQISEAWPQFSNALPQASELWPQEDGLHVLLLGACAMLLLGLRDDVRSLPWWQKLLLELGLACWACRSGLQLQVHFLSTDMAQLVSVAWLVGVANALNLIDVADGLASGVAAVASLGLAVLAFQLRCPAIAIVCLALAGGSMGFLPANWPPARQYLGDAGSLSLGFTLAGLALLLDYRGGPPHALWAPVGILAVPLLETALVTCARVRRGASPFMGSADHFALRLQARGWKPLRVLRCTLGATCLMACWGLGMAAVTEAAAVWLLPAGLGLGVGTFVWLWQLELPEIHDAASVRVDETLVASHRL
jgi:UDP-GlcNAc:undecaprenyl-phosphate GlcNAc-1-phosphate transferase